MMTPETAHMDQWHLHKNKIQKHHVRMEFARF